MGLGALAALQGGGNVLGGIISGVGDQRAARASAKQIQAAQEANEKALQQQQALQQPYMSAGNVGLQKYAQGVQQGQNPYAQYSMSQFSGVDMSKDPGVQYRIEQSNKALNESAAKGGYLMSGWQQKALQENAQNLASQEYANAYDRQYGQFKDTEDAKRQQYNLDRDYTQGLNAYNMQNALNLANIGQSATNTASQNIGQSNQTAMNLYEAMAGAKAKKARGMWGTIGDAVSGGTNTGANAYMAYLMGV